MGFKIIERKAVKMKLKKLGAALAAVSCIAALACAVGCAQTAIEEETEDPYTVEQYLPRIIQEEDGTLIQLTPDEEPTDVAYFIQGGGDKDFVPYNTYFAKSNERGCASCHDDLRQLLEDSPYDHPALIGADTEWTIHQCLDCHTVGNGYLTHEHVFSTMIHAIHGEISNCWQCHDTTTTDNSSNSTMYLWEDVKADKLRGITKIASDGLNGSFSFSQDEVVEPENLGNLNAQLYDWDFLRAQYVDEGTPIDETLPNDWTIEVYGEVDTPMTFNLKELMETAPMVTKLVKWECGFNPTGGSLMGQVEVTGIPLSYLLEQTGVKDTVASIMAYGIDGYNCAYGVPIEEFDGHDAIIAVEMNGEPLLWQNGYPCTFVIPGQGMGSFAKHVAAIELLNSDSYAAIQLGWRDETGENRINMPNVGIFELQDGQVVKTGESLKVRGYASAYVNNIAAIEISMDGGATWKRFDTPGTDHDRWVTWEYEFTPEEDTTYRFAVRSVLETGRTTPEPIEKLIVAHSNPEELV